MHTHVREDAIVLYGFPSRDERACFEALIGAHGVGPAVALALLSVHSPAALQRAVLDRRRRRPDAGARASARRPPSGCWSSSKPAWTSTSTAPISSLLGRRRAARAEAAGRGATRAEVRAALAGLGYGADEIRHALGRLPADGDLEDQIRLALRELAGAR